MRPLPMRMLNGCECTNPTLAATTLSCPPRSWWTQTLAGTRSISSSSTATLNPCGSKAVCRCGVAMHHCFSHSECGLLFLTWQVTYKDRLSYVGSGTEAEWKPIRRAWRNVPCMQGGKQKVAVNETEPSCASSLMTLMVVLVVKQY